MQRILIIKLGAFGDVIQAAGAISDIRAHHTDAHIAVLTTPAFRKIFERCPHVNQVLIDARVPRWRLDKMLALKRLLATEKFDRVYDLQNNPRTGFYRRWLLPTVPWSGRTATKADKQIPALQRIATQLTAAGVPLQQTFAPNVGWLADDVSTALAEAGVKAPYITLIPGCSARHPYKRWPYYNDLAKRLQAAGHCVVTAPGPDELKEADTFPGIVLRGPRGFFNWFELAGVLQGSAFVVGNDTGPSHLAANLGTAGLALFGPHTSAVRTSILRPRFTALEVPDLKALSVDTVWAELRQKAPELNL